MNSLLSLGAIQFELLVDRGRFLGLGKISINGTRVRSGRLPLSVETITFSGLQFDHLELLDVSESQSEIRIHLRPWYAPVPIQLMRDHSFDPIHDSNDWDAVKLENGGELDLVLKLAEDSFNGVKGEGFAYHYEYRGSRVGIFYLMDKASWELDGDITMGTAVSQSACSDPVVKFEEDTAWSTEGIIHWVPDIANPVMTHNLPRWASHQAFDFQWKSGRALLGVFERVDLIRTLVKRESGAAELKVFDKHIFDESERVVTTAKMILLVEGIASETAMQNLWTWIIEEVHDRARSEFGLVQEPTLPRLAVNYWSNFNFDSYFKDLIPAAKEIGIRQVFIDNVNKSAMTESGGVGNMCCGHEYEPAPLLGGTSKLKELVERSDASGIQIMSWTNNDQAYTSPLNASERDEAGWYVKMEDTRLKYGGAYTNVFSIWDFNSDDARRNWIDCLIRIRKETGLNGYLFDSFYNLGFMPVSYANGKPRTMWRKLLEAFKELQDADVHFLIESFGPFGQVQHGCPRTYSIDRCWVCYEIGVGDDYTTVPTGLARHEDARTDSAEVLHFILAHKTVPPIALHKDGKRVDELWTEAHKRALADYHIVRPLMKRRYLQENGRAIVWHNEKQDTAVIWSFVEQTVSLSGVVFDVTKGEELPASAAYNLEPMHTYTVKGSVPPSLLEQ